MQTQQPLLATQQMREAYIIMEEQVNTMAAMAAHGMHYIKMKTKYILIILAILLVSIPLVSAKAVNSQLFKPVIRNNCELMYGTGNINNMNIYFFGANYENSNDLKADVNMMLYSTNETKGLGLMTIEPFKSNLGKMNIYFIPVKLNNTDADACYLAVENISKYCKNYNYDRGKDYIHVIVNQDKLINGAYGQGGGNGCSEALRKGQGNYTDSVSLFLHEIGHSLGLLDNYANIYYTGGVSYPYEFNLVNCDPNAGCPKWCKGKPAAHFENPCENYTDNATCVSHLTDKNCIWLKDKDPYFNANCIKNDDYHDDYTKSRNIGIGCIAGTGCYAGCSGGGYRPTPINNFVYISTYKEAIRTDIQGKKHMYNPIAENYIKDKYFKTMIKGPSPIKIGMPLY